MPHQDISACEEHQEFYRLERAKELRYYAKHNFSALINRRYVDCRHLIVEYIINLSNSLGLQRSTTQTAIELYDRYLDMNHKVSRCNLQLVSITTIYIASKNNESYNVPTLQTLNISTNESYSEDLIRNMEMEILSVLNWHVTPVTMADFLDYYLLVAIQPIDYQFSGQGYASYEDFKNHFGYTLNKFIMTVEACSTTRLEKPSKVAAACIAATRLVMQINPPWKPSLVQASGYVLKKCNIKCNNKCNDEPNKYTTSTLSNHQQLASNE
eukprot:gene1491-1732_t